MDGSKIKLLKLKFEALDTRLCSRTSPQNQIFEAETKFRANRKILLEIPADRKFLAMEPEEKKRSLVQKLWFESEALNPLAFEPSLFGFAELPFQGLFCQHS